MSNTKRNTIAVMMRDINTDFSEAMYDGFYNAAIEENVNLIYLLGPQYPKNVENIVNENVDIDYDFQPDTVFDYANLIKPDGLIIVSGSLRNSLVLPDVNALVERYKDIPTLVMEDVPKKPGVAYQVADSYAAMCQCLEHLIIHHGYSSIVYVSGDPDEYDFAERLRAFKDTMNAHCLEADDEHIVICGSNESYERKIHTIFDDFPYVEAIVCSCDTYARIAYRICNTRGLVVGRDVAITGFDDLGISASMNPPLTGVMHNSFKFGYNALKRAVSIANGEKVGGIKSSCKFMRRASCGCRNHINPTEQEVASGNISVSKQVKELIVNRIPKIIDETFVIFSYEKEKKAFKELYYELFSYIYKNIFTEWTDTEEIFENIAKYINKLFSIKGISVRNLSNKTSALLEEMMYLISSDKEKAKLTAMIFETNKQIKESEIIKMRDAHNRRSEQLWFVSFFTRDLMKANMPYADTIGYLMKKLRGMDIKSAHIFLFRKPVTCKKNQLPPVPTEVYQAGFYNEHEMRVYLPQNSITINCDNGIKSMLSDEECRNYSAFVLYSGNRQYGIVLFEVNKEDVFFAMTCSLQIGSLLHFRDVCDEEEAARSKLREQNDILSYISQKDDLTDALNYRGFLEQTVKQINRRSGRRAFVYFAKVEKLNEINTTYGHVFGDNTLITVANLLRNALPEDSLMGRLGGNEFVAIIYDDSQEVIEETDERLSSNVDKHNKSSDEEYRIVVSTQSFQFTCEMGINMTELLRTAKSQVINKYS